MEKGYTDSRYLTEFYFTLLLCFIVMCAGYTLLYGCYIIKNLRKSCITEVRYMEKVSGIII